jgi:hypothetical protein
MDFWIKSVPPAKYNESAVKGEWARYMGLHKRE